MVNPTLNPRLRHQEKVRDVIDLIARFGFASASNITLATGSTRRGFATELHEAGILTCRPTSGLIVAGKGVSAIFGLAKRSAIDANVKYVDIWKVSSSRAAHALVLQSETLRAKSGGIYPNPHIVLVDYKIEPRTVGSSVRYDAIWHMRNLASNTAVIPVSVEAERSEKYGRELDLFFTKLLFASTQSLVLFESNELMCRYLEHAQKYKGAGSIPHWKCTNGEWWLLEDRKPITDASWGRIAFRLAGTNLTVRLSGDLSIAKDATSMMGPVF